MPTRVGSPPKSREGGRGAEKTAALLDGERDARLHVLFFQRSLSSVGSLRPCPYESGDITPSVTIVLAAHNEAAGIGAKLENVLSLDYPSEQLEVIVASDGCDDVDRRDRQGVRKLPRPASFRYPGAARRRRSTQPPTRRAGRSSSLGCELDVRA